jgi:hypothetical protein
MRGHAGLPVPPKRVIATSCARRIIKPGYSQDHEHGICFQFLCPGPSVPVKENCETKNLASSRSKQESRWVYKILTHKEKVVHNLKRPLLRSQVSSSLRFSPSTSECRPQSDSENHPKVSHRAGVANHPKEINILPDTIMYAPQDMLKTVDMVLLSVAYALWFGTSVV